MGLAMLVSMGSGAAAEDQKPSFDPYVSAKQDEGFIPRMKSMDGKSQSFGRPLRTPPGVTGMYTGIWKAGPGVYRSEGARPEIFVVVEGRGTIWIQGYGTHVLEPGVIITTPAATPAEITVEQPLKKVSWVDVSHCPITDKDPKNC
jgi:uncharacterized cupin superfamily protein